MARYTKAYVKTNTLIEETDLLQLGQSHKEVFDVMEFNEPRKSSIDNFPTKANPEYRYQYQAVNIEIIPQ